MLGERRDTNSGNKVFSSDSGWDGVVLASLYVTAFHASPPAVAETREKPL
jgi:hypothetical protein